MFYFEKLPHFLRYICLWLTIDSRFILYLENTKDFVTLYHVLFLTAGLTLNRCVAKIKVGNGLPLTGLPLHNLIVKSPK